MLHNERAQIRNMTTWKKGKQENCFRLIFFCNEEN